MTNLDVIKSYGSEEMADFITDLLSPDNCEECPADITCDYLMATGNGFMNCIQKIEVWLNKSVEEME